MNKIYLIETNMSCQIKSLIFRDIIYYIIYYNNILKIRKSFTKNI